MSPAVERARLGQGQQRSYWGQAWLVWAIALYRRYLSGRGPLRGVTCTFHHTETCSAYGLRMARTAPSLVVALREIWNRLRRCRRASLYRSRDGHVKMWDELYDDLRPSVFEAELRRERRTTRAALLWAALCIAARRGERLPLRRRLLQRLRRLLRRPPRAEEMLITRSVAVLWARPRRQLLVGAVMTCIIVAPLAVIVALGASWKLCVGVVVAALVLLLLRYVLALHSLRRRSWMSQARAPAE